MDNPLGCSNIFWRWAWEAVGGYDESLIHQEALDFSIWIAEVGEITFLHEAVYFYHRRDGSLSTDIQGIVDARKVIAEKQE